MAQALGLEIGSSQVTVRRVADPLGYGVVPVGGMGQVVRDRQRSDAGCVHRRAARNRQLEQELCCRGTPDQVQGQPDIL
jgi:hypothetical protein